MTRQSALSAFEETRFISVSKEGLAGMAKIDS
jgi:hypothetical protein